MKKKRKGDKHARTIHVGSKSHPEGKGKAWVIKKKQQMRNRGVKVANIPNIPEENGKNGFDSTAIVILNIWTYRNT